MGARFQLIFVDYVSQQHSMISANTRFVFDPRFDNVLTPKEKEFKELFLEFTHSLPESARDSNSWKQLEGLVGKMGYNPSHYGRYYDTKRGKHHTQQMRDRLDSESPEGGLGLTQTAAANQTAAFKSAMSAKSATSAKSSTELPSPPPSPTPPDLTPMEILARKLRTPALFRKLSSFKCLDHPERLKLLEAVAATIPTPPDPIAFATFPSPKEPGHVFIANNSVIEIFCDAFLAPAAMGGRGMPTGTGEEMKRAHTHVRTRGAAV